MLRLLDHLTEDAVRVGLSAPDKDAVLDRVADLALEQGLVKDRARLRNIVAHREAIVTTGIGKGVAVPHADLPELETPRLALAVFPDGVEFDSLDEEPVHLVFLLLGTPRTPELHMKILARIARLSKDPELVPSLCRCATGAEACEALAMVEARHG